ncbi:hypothetical protein HN011_008342 [Eciton burchellii]|nr:hypothetical protein HN011_008342 [Eciton burchellii]
MLPIVKPHIIPKYNIKSSNLILSPWINITIRSCTSSSDSSSDSDSDSDNEKAKSKQTYVKNTANVTSNNGKQLGHFLDNMIKQNTTSIQIPKEQLIKSSINSKRMDQKTTESTTIKSDISLMEYINNMMTAKKLEKTIDVAMPPKKPKDASRKTKHVSYEKKLTSAVEDVANILGGNKTKTTSDLLQKALAYKTETSQEEYLTKIKLEQQRKIGQSLENTTKQKDFQTENYSTQKSVIYNLLKEYRKQQETKTKNEKQSYHQSSIVDNKEQPVVENSISRQLLSQNRISEQPNYNRSNHREDIDLWNGKPSDIFNNMGTVSSDMPVLKMWRALEERELKLLTSCPPANIFQEMILWTEQGKLWKFPIDNEQGMEEESNIHFSEHIFMERHLKDWCPKLGPIRHFMELVCNGLSKNPYLTVQEKINHIMWYKEYFESKQDLLQQLEVIQEVFPDKIKKIQE